MQREELNFLLQKSDFSALKELYQKIKKAYDIVVLQSPTQQTLLQPIHDPISQGEFYGGEILVTTTIVTVENKSNKGWAMVMDESEKLSLYIAVCDGAYGGGYYKEEIEQLAQTTQKSIKNLQERENQKVNATKVNFDLMA